MLLPLLIHFVALCMLAMKPLGERAVEFQIFDSTNPEDLARTGCNQDYESCYHIAVAAIQLQKSRMFSSALEGWSWSDTCGCSLPPREKQQVLQYLHIPKSSTSINWFLHDYFECTAQNSTEPCPRWLRNHDEQKQGLCNGRLFSCAGHRVSEELPVIALGGSTKMLTMLRHPWYRLQSDYHYLKVKPTSGHLGPEINVTDLMRVSTNLSNFVSYPGIANCATKMLTGRQCAENVELVEADLETAKRVLSSMLFVGITEYFESSICQFAWIYGGSPHRQQHFRRSREGGYRPLTIEEALSPSEVSQFLRSERFDLALYQFAVELFKTRQAVLECPLHYE